GDDRGDEGEVVGEGVVDDPRVGKAVVGTEEERQVQVTVDRAGLRGHAQAAVHHLSDLGRADRRAGVKRGTGAAGGGLVHAVEAGLHGRGHGGVGYAARGVGADAVGDSRRGRTLGTARRGLGGDRGVAARRTPTGGGGD